MKHIVIIGNGIAGITTARHVRKQSDHAITVVSVESAHFFSRTALMYIYMGHMTYANTKPFADDFWAKNRIMIKQAYVEAVDPDNKSLQLGDGTVLSYDMLVVAVGSKPNRFGWPGQALAGVHWYGFGVGSIFAGFIGTGFYPLMGNRVCCRFGCPLAAYLGLVQRFRSRFRITTNGGQCISCGNCSTHCEMGIDVRWYAQRGQDIVRSSCVGCGICSAVCPRGVLNLENGPVESRVMQPNPIILGNDSITVRVPE